jgi:heat-inducible transcriptional repressor
LKTLFSKRPSKDDREKAVLIGLVTLYLKTGRPVGSQTLKENGFDSLSPATLRNYFAKLEKGGFLKQHHSSGGRVPTGPAYKVYADSICESSTLEEDEKKKLASLLEKETREVSLYLQKAAETLSDFTQGAVFLSSPRFDQDFVQDIKLMNIDAYRILCVVVTDFGNVRSEVLFTDQALSDSLLKKIEQFFEWRLSSQNRPNLSAEEERMAVKFYNEAMFRHIMNYSTFSSSDILKTGFSRILNYPDFNDASSLASGLSLLENDNTLRVLLAKTVENNELTFWIGDELTPFSPAASACSVLSIPYRIHNTPVGSIGLLCPHRAPYEKLFASLKVASESLSTSLTKSLYKFKISYREPKEAQLDLNKQTALLSATKGEILLEDKTIKRE